MDAWLDLIGTKIGRFLTLDAMLPGLITSLWIFAGVMLVELLLVGYRGSSISRVLSRDAPSVRVDLLMAILNSAGISLLIGILMTVGLASWLTRAVQNHVSMEWHDAIDRSAVLGQLVGVAAVVLTDFLYYWYHRLMHVFAPLWCIHRFHHEAEEFSVLTAVRTHPVEVAGEMVARAVPVALLGAPVGYAASLFVVGRVVSALHHSKLQSDWGFIGRWFFVSPCAHQIHHSADPRHFGSNFGFIFPWWDRLFGSWLEVDRPVDQLGIPGAERRARSLWGGNLMAYVDSLKSFVSFKWRV